NDAQYFFYLQETREAENIIARFVSERLKLTDLKLGVDWLDAYLDKEAKEIAVKIDDFDTAAFKEERHRLMTGALQRRFYCITGRPGAGKTEAVHALLDHFEQAGERAAVLAPTGKAALRLTGKAKTNATWKAETMDRWIYQSGLAAYLNGEAPISKMSRSDRYEPIDNLIIDEMSMADLSHLAVVFRSLEVNQPGSIKRVILVGDENPLPPIGCGRAFYDIIAYLREDATTEHRNLVRLTTNCRQQHDRVLLDAAHLFAGKNRYHTELYDKLLTGGQISTHFKVEYWETTAHLQELVANWIDAVLLEAVSDGDG